MDEAKLKEIKLAEEKAQTILDDARKEYSRIVGEAGEEGLSIFDQQKKKVKSEYNQYLDNQKKAGDTEAQQIISGLDKELSEIEAHAKKNADQAVKYLLDQIREKYGNH